MRVTVIDEKTLRALNNLLGDRSGSGALDQLKNLNPHVDFKRIDLGTVLLIPDGPNFRDLDSSTVTGDSFGELRKQILATIDAAALRLRGGYDALLTEQKEVLEVLTSKSVTEARRTDSALEQQIDAANSVFKSDHGQARIVEKQLQALREQVKEELDSLTNALG
jgi:hypothetical protein